MKVVLIIEDEEALRDVYAQILRVAGYTVELAENGKVGISKLKSCKPDLILLDMLMPVMSGKVFLETAELTTLYPNTKVVVISNLTDPITEKENKKYRTVASLVKANLTPADLIKTVKKYCS